MRFLLPVRWKPFSLADVDPAIANIIAYNLADSIDKVAMD
jgi:hypothetical protein